MNAAISRHRLSIAIGLIGVMLVLTGCASKQSAAAELIDGIGAGRRAAANVGWAAVMCARLASTCSERDDPLVCELHRVLCATASDDATVCSQARTACDAATCSASCVSLSCDVVGNLCNVNAGDAAADSATTGDSVQPDGGAVEPDSGSVPLDSGAAPHDSSTPPPASGAIIVNSSHIALFERIPAQYLNAARDLKMLFSDRSVGQNINESLDCLTAPTYGQSSNACRRGWDRSAPLFSATRGYSQADYDADRVPAWLRFAPSPTSYDRSNWVFEYRGGSWQQLTADFVTSLAPQYLSAGFDVVGYQLSYLNIESSTLIDPQVGFFSNAPNAPGIDDIEALMARYPTRTFIFWTTSLARSLGTQVARDFNAQLRQYASANGRVLFDVADIESHDPNGAPCYDNRDGVQYCSPTNASHCENHPDDGVQYPAICRDYTTEVEGGHLGSVSGARIRIAKAFWVLMARIAGWNP